MIVAWLIVYRGKSVSTHEFYGKLLTHVQSLETMGKLNTVEGYMISTLDKLSEIWSDLVRLDG